MKNALVNQLKSPETRGSHGIIRTAPISACNTRRGLTRSSGTSREGLAVNATRKATDEQLIEAYAELGNVHKVGERFGMHGSSAHQRLVKLGAAKPMNYFTEADKQRLREEYADHRARGKVQDLADSMGRTVQFLSRKARDLGISDASHEKEWRGVWKYMPEAEARALFDDFKASPMTMKDFCKSRSLDDDGIYRAVRDRWPDEWEYVIESKVITGSMYQIGRKFEHEVRDDLIVAGYHATRSNQSRTPADVIAFQAGAILLVQCKTTWDIPTDEWNVLFDLAASTGALPILAQRNNAGKPDYFRLTGRKDGLRQTARPCESFTPGVMVTISKLEEVK